MSDHQRRFVIGVADDDQRVLESLALLLDSADYESRLFSTAAALLESHELHTIDCVISDVAMPGLDGFALVRALHAVRPGLPVILVSGRSDLLEQSPRDGPAPFRTFKKPFDGQELLAAVGDALQNCDPRTPSAS